MDFVHCFGYFHRLTVILLSPEFLYDVASHKAVGIS